MLFKVSRTSYYTDEKDHPPCKEAIWQTYIRVDERNVDDPKKLTYNNAFNDWFGNGVNHRVENGHIKRDFQDEGWFIEINSLEEMIDFCNRYGELVIDKFYSNLELMEVEIYDIYRE